MTEEITQQMENVNLDEDHFSKLPLSVRQKILDEAIDESKLRQEITDVKTAKNSSTTELNNRINRVTDLTNRANDLIAAGDPSYLSVLRVANTQNSFVNILLRDVVEKTETLNRLKNIYYFYDLNLRRSRREY